MNQADQGIVYKEKPFQWLRNLSTLCTILGFLSLVGGCVMGYDAASNMYDSTLGFMLWFAAGFVGGIGYLIIADVIKLFLAAKENLEELVASTREIIAHLKETRSE